MSNVVKFPDGEKEENKHKDYEVPHDATIDAEEFIDYVMENPNVEEAIVIVKYTDHHIHTEVTHELTEDAKDLMDLTILQMSFHDMTSNDN